jgi:hypothetical protein
MHAVFRDASKNPPPVFVFFRSINVFPLSENPIVDQLVDKNTTLVTFFHLFRALEDSNPNTLRPNLCRMQKNCIIGTRQGLDLCKTPIPPEKFVD